MANLSTEKLAWFDLDPSMFPKEAQAALKKAESSRKQAAIDTKAADDILQTFAPRIQVPQKTGKMMQTPSGSFYEETVQRKLLADGETMVISHRFGKLSVAATTTEKKKAKGEKSATLA